jgi:hypothetical protein
MSQSPRVDAHLAALEELSRHTLSRREDLAVLMEAAYRSGRSDTLEQLSFLAKFCVRTFGIMQRVGQGGEGYDRLAQEFEARVEQARSVLHSLLEGTEPQTNASLNERYLAMTPGSLRELLTLLRDLSWHKNWRIDHPEESPW